MSVKQFRIKMENKSGKLSNLSEILGEQGVNIRAICVSHMASEASNVCIVVDDPKRAKDALKARGIEHTEHEILAVEMPDHPGGMNAVLKPLRDANINAITVYPYIGRASNPIMIIEVDHIKKATDVLKHNWVKVWDKSVYKL
jgi:hypothetical protein